MSFLSRIQEDVRDVINCYASAREINNSHPDGGFPELLMYPGILEITMVALIPINTAIGVYRMRNGGYWDEFVPTIAGPLHTLKHSPIVILAVTLLAAKHSKSTLGGLAVAYGIKKLIS